MATLFENLEKMSSMVDSVMGNNGKDSLLRKPIGGVLKNYGYMLNMLYHNIGNHQYNFDGYGTMIGVTANPYLNSEVNPWFLLDEERQRYSDYLLYVNQTYFKGTMAPPNFTSTNERMKVFDYNALMEENSRVGAIHTYDLETALQERTNISNGATNPNGDSDTRLGVINNFYLSSALYNTQEKMLNKETSSYHVPSYGKKEGLNPFSFSITQGAYFKYGLTGEMGLGTDTYMLNKGTVRAQSLMTDVAKLWTKDDIINNESPFGNYYDLMDSSGLILSSGGKTQEFIAKSIHGLDLLSDTKVSLEYNKNNKFKGRKKYGALIGSRGTNYVDMMTGNEVKYESRGLNSGDLIRLELQEPGNDNFAAYNTYLQYAEAEKNQTDTPKYSSASSDNGTYVSNYTTYVDGNLRRDDIIRYTNEQFKANKYKTLIGRFHTDSFDDPNDVKKDMTSSAVSQYGMSRGRNLLKKEPQGSTTNGFHDPYCRVWTYHKQYSKYSNLIRPFLNDDKEKLNELLKETYQVNRQHLVDNGVRNNTNGLVNFILDPNDIYKRCMFSIENLAWKGCKLFGDNKYTLGPNGGRIMWFPPYGLTFNENVSANWNSTQFIGRGEKIYSYVDTERGGNLSFNLLIDHPSVLNVKRGVDDTVGNVDDVNSHEQEVLRFFAGCEVLNLPKNEKTNDENKTVNKTTTNTDTSFDKKISFKVYFPNNYSGKDDGDDFYVYLCNGLAGDTEFLVEEEREEDSSLIFSSKNNKLYLVEEDASFNQIGGYEQDTDYGISVVSGEVNGNILSDNICPMDSEGFISGDIKIILIKYETKWGYRVDNDKKEKSLLINKNYYDFTNFNLNCKPYKEKVEDSTTLYCSFNDMVSYLDKDFAENVGLSLTKSKEITSLIEGHKIVSIEVIGCASKDGNEDENKQLAEDRAKTIRDWLKNKLSNKISENSIRVSTITSQEATNGDINSLVAKQNRSAQVDIVLKTVQEEDVSSNGNTVSKSEEESSRAITVAIAEQENTTDSRYTYNETDFFNYVNSGDTLMRNKIIDKIKYFDPGYHSITPEGFNNRLTFLHQCTRQGSTNSASDGGKNISNLSFGAPPICVLRIGDFYNTKIIIESLTISYDESCWDLNDEGIGVMPMLAKIDIGFKFIGGSDLSGPIARLQNAVSFNYYANTRVYDKSSETNNNEI